VEFIEYPIDAAENKRSEDRAPFQLRKCLLLVERPSHKPAQDEIEAGVHNLIGPRRGLGTKEEVGKVGENENDKNPQEWRQLIFQNISQSLSTFFIAVGSWSIRS